MYMGDKEKETPVKSEKARQLEMGVRQQDLITLPITK